MTRREIVIKDRPSVQLPVLTGWFYLGKLANLGDRIQAAGSRKHPLDL